MLGNLESQKVIKNDYIGVAAGCSLIEILVWDMLKWKIGSTVLAIHSPGEQMDKICSKLCTIIAENLMFFAVVVVAPAVNIKM